MEVVFKPDYRHSTVKNSAHSSRTSLSSFFKYFLEPRPLKMQMMITYLDKILSLIFLKKSLTIYFVLTSFQLVLGFFWESRNISCMYLITYKPHSVPPSCWGHYIGKTNNIIRKVWIMSEKKLILINKYYLNICMTPKKFFSVILPASLCYIQFICPIQEE